MLGKKKLAFYLFCINGNGQAKVMLDIAGGLAKRGHSVDFYYVKMDNSVYMRHYDGIISYHSLSTSTRWGAILSLRKVLSNSEYDFVFTAGNDNNCSIILAKLFKKINTKIIITEHNSLSNVVQKSKKILAKFLPYFVRILYGYSNALVSVSNGIKDEIENKFKVKNPYSTVIFNPVVDNKLHGLKNNTPIHPWFDGSYKVFLGVGRLAIQKDFSSLIKAFSLIKDNPSYKLIILGEGEERVNLEYLINELNISNQVDLLGRVDNPYAYMSASNVFVLSSKFEGLPTVLIEALACDMTIVSTDCPHGPSEILENGKWGYLVPVDDVYALSNAMKTALDKPINGSIRAGFFSYNNSIDCYENLLKELIGEEK